MRIITSVRDYIDSDAYGGCVAYAELLNLQGTPATAISTSALNESITPAMRAWRTPLSTTYTPDDRDRFTLIDVADPEAFDPIVVLDRVEEVIDHRPGFQAYWQERLGDKADTSVVGAVCTKICERWRAAGLLDRMSQTSARLLMCGILDNTLNFGAEITTERDRQAYVALSERAGLPDDWPDTYFSDCQQSINADLPAAIKGDFRNFRFGGLPEKIGAGQLVVWDARQLLDQDLETIERIMPALANRWFMNIIGVDEKKNYLLCHDPAIQAWLADLLGVGFQNDLAKTSRLYLRKEILQASINKGKE